jgi:hypothetical protein
MFRDILWGNQTRVLTRGETVHILLVLISFPKLDWDDTVVYCSVRTIYLFVAIIFL